MPSGRIGFIKERFKVGINDIVIPIINKVAIKNNTSVVLAIVSIPLLIA